MRLRAEENADHQFTIGEMHAGDGWLRSKHTAVLCNVKVVMSGHGFGGINGAEIVVE